ncbi:MAG: nitroreductase family protein [Candidatus Eisenbacteria bacterium]
MMIDRTAPNDSKRGTPDHPVHDLITGRWSPYTYEDHMVSLADLRSIFEAARWAASSFNEQPWRYIVATKDDPKAYEKLLSRLVEGNQGWAKAAPVLALGLVKKTFTRNAKPNRVALHDLGAASATLTFEASARGVKVHQMGGILPDRAREIYGVPDDFEVVTGIALGYEAPPTPTPASSANGTSPPAPGIPSPTTSSAAGSANRRRSRGRGGERRGPGPRHSAGAGGRCPLSFGESLERTPRIGGLNLDSP